VPDAHRRSASRAERLGWAAQKADRGQMLIIRAFVHTFSAQLFPPAQLDQGVRRKPETANRQNGGQPRRARPAIAGMMRS